MHTCRHNWASFSNCTWNTNFYDLATPNL